MRRKLTDFRSQTRWLFALLALGLVTVLLLPAGALAAGNLILNPEFDSGTANWTLGNWGGAASSWSVVTGAGLSGPNAARVVISNPGTTSFHVQLRQPLPITAGRIYTITFRARANAARTMNAVIQQLNDPWTTYWTSPTVNLTTTAQTFGPYTFTAGTTDASALFEFYLGANGSTVYLDQVVVSDNSIGATATATRTNTPVGPTATRTRTPTPGSTTGVIFYQDINYGGAASGAKAIGDYTSLPADVPNDWMSSLRVPAGWAVDAYANGGYGGAVCTFTADSAWVGTACNDMMSSFRIRLATSNPPTATRTPTIPPSNALEMWDDFNYSSSGDPNINAHGWVIRSGTGGPGKGGPGWSSGNFAFVDDGSGNRLMRMSASNSGTGSISSQAEIHTSAKKFLYGTYAARIFWRNAPSSGSPDGDQVIQTFFSITLDTPLCDDFNYGELDFEYLPNGGFAFPDGLPRLWNTSWDRCTPEEYQQNTYQADWSGWHKIIFQVTSASVKYYIDGNLLATHGATYVPEIPQHIDFNLWFFRRLANATSRTYQQDVDWTYFIKDASLSPAEVDARVNGFRSTTTTFKDTVP